MSNEKMPKKNRRLHVVYARRMEERRVFLNELQEIRNHIYWSVYKEIKKKVGPKWYQVLSPRWRSALKQLGPAMHQDDIDGRPTRTREILRILSIHPIPHKLVIQSCMYKSQFDPKEFLATLFYTMFDHHINQKRLSYDLNMRIICSSIFYLGQDDLIQSLREQFKPAKPEIKKAERKKKKRPRKLESPYLQTFKAGYYFPKKSRPKPPPPLPDLEFLNAPYHEDTPPPAPRPAPPPPPPPVPKKRIPRNYCDKMAEVFTVKPPEQLTSRKTISRRKSRMIRHNTTNVNEAEPKKVYGLGDLLGRLKKKRRKPRAHTNVQHLIQGVWVYKEKPYFILAAVTIRPLSGYFIHGGHKRMKSGNYMPINQGISAYPQPSQLGTCNCLQNWSGSVFRYIENTKCHCGHYYDYGHKEGTLNEEDVPFFVKPSRKGNYKFNYDEIYETDPRLIEVHKEIKKVWDNDSVLQEDDPDDPDATLRRNKKKKRQEILRQPSATCLGNNPTIEDYLRCALRFLRCTNTAAKLPDVHLAPEIIEWMRRRVYGPLSKRQKTVKLRRSELYWNLMKCYQKHGLGTIVPQYDPAFKINTNWHKKHALVAKYRSFYMKHRLRLYRAQAYAHNLLWMTMFNAQFPDKSFRQTFFSYQCSQVEDLSLVHPYSTVESGARAKNLLEKRYVCLPKNAIIVGQ